MSIAEKPAEISYLTQATKLLLSPITFKDGLVLHLSLDIDEARFVAHFTHEEYGEFYGGFGYRFEEFLNRFPEKRRLTGDGKWMFAGTDITALLINHVWEKAGNTKIEFEDQLTELTYQTLLVRHSLQTGNIVAIAKYKEHGLVEDAHWFKDNTKESELSLTPYQKLAAICALRSESFALHMDMGTGKTPVAISVMCNDALRLFNKRMYKMLIVCPKTVQMNWQFEIKRFATIDGKITVLRGTKLERVKLFLQAMVRENEEKYSAVIISYDTMSRMVEALTMTEWDLCVLDEAHGIALPSTLRAKSSMKLREFCKRRMELTGTPIRNSPLDLYSQLEFLGAGFSGFQSAKNFKNFYGVWTSADQNGHGENNILIGMQNLAFLRERLARLSYRITKEEALPHLPSKTYDIVEVEMSAEQRKAYNELRDHLALEIDHDIEGMKTETRSLVINNILTKLLRLAQITSGFMVLDEVVDEMTGIVIRPKAIRKFDPNAKLDELMEVLKGKKSHEKTIIWACWLADINAIEDRLRESGHKFVSYYGKLRDVVRDENVRMFNEDRDTKFFVGNPGAGGVGLNLIGYPPERADEYETNCTHVIYYSGDWSQVKRTQSEDRVHRRGTREPIRITDLVVAGSIDEEIRARVFQKKKMALEITDIRSIMKAVLGGELE